MDFLLCDNALTYEKLHSQPTFYARCARFSADGVTVTGSSVLADKLVVCAAGLMGENLSCAPHSDALANPHNIDRAGRNTAELCERALNGSPMYLGFIHSNVAGLGGRW